MVTERGDGKASPVLVISISSPVTLHQSRVTSHALSVTRHQSSSLMPACFTTFTHFARSARIHAPSSSLVLG